MQINILLISNYIFLILLVIMSFNDVLASCNERWSCCPENVPQLICGFDCPTCVVVPIDNGLIFLFFAGAFYGGVKIRERINK